MQGRFERLAGSDGDLVQHEMVPLRQEWSTLAKDVTDMLNEQQDSLELCRAYHMRHNQADADLVALTTQLDAIQQDTDAPVLGKLHKLKV